MLEVALVRALLVRKYDVAYVVAVRRSTTGHLDVDVIVRGGS